jgi:hypothetical protein
MKLPRPTFSVVVPARDLMGRVVVFAFESFVSLVCLVISVPLEMKRAGES